MSKIYKEIDEAITQELGGLDQSSEFKRRFRKLIENAIIGNITDSDVNQAVQLLHVNDEVD